MSSEIELIRKLKRISFDEMDRKVTDWARNWSDDRSYRSLLNEGNWTVDEFDDERERRRSKFYD
jgi:hypothetical protein